MWPGGKGKIEKATIMSHFTLFEDTSLGKSVPSKIPNFCF